MIYFQLPKSNSFIKEFWIWDGVLASDLPWILPSYETECVFHISKPPSLHKKNPDSIIQLTDTHWVGPQNERWKLFAEHPLQIFGIRFHPGSIFECFGIQGDYLRNQFHTVTEQVLVYCQEEIFNYLKIHNHKIDDQFFLSKEFEAIENHLQTHLSIRSKIEADIKKVFTKLLLGEKGINDLAKMANISRKQLERKFLKIFGMPPGELKKIHRVLSMIRDPKNYKSENQNAKLTDIAYEYNFNDQSHLIKDFKQMTGYLPKEWFVLHEKMSHFYNYQKDK